MRKVLILLAILTLGWPGTQALAQGHARERVRSGEVQPLDRILPEIRRDHPGSFYDAEGPFPDANGGYRYRLKWLTPEGRVIWLDTDARTGRVLNARRGEEREMQDRPVPPPERFRDDGNRGGFYHDRRNDWPGGGNRGHWNAWGGRGPGDGHRGHGH